MWHWCCVDNPLLWYIVPLILTFMVFDFHFLHQMLISVYHYCWYSVYCIFIVIIVIDDDTYIFIIVITFLIILLVFIIIVIMVLWYILVLLLLMLLCCVCIIILFVLCGNIAMTLFIDMIVVIDVNYYHYCIVNVLMLYY